MRVLLILLAFLAGCATPVVTQKSINGVSYTEHMNTEDMPCDFPADGCFQQREDGSKHVWLSNMSKPQARHHEVEGHVLGMRHTPWGKDMFGRPCATIMIGNADYPAGKTICNTRHGEIVF